MVKKRITVNVDVEDIDYLNDKRFNKSLFFRQAIAAFKRKKFKYVSKQRKR